MNICEIFINAFLEAFGLLSFPARADEKEIFYIQRGLDYSIDLIAKEKQHRNSAIIFMLENRG